MTFYQTWEQYQWYVSGAILAVFLIYVFIRFKGRGALNDPFSSNDEFDKSGQVFLYDVEKEQEGASFLTFERADGTIENRQIGQPFTFVMEDGVTIERHHLNPRGSHRCVDPQRLFADFKPSKRDINKIAAYTEQQQRQLRTGSYSSNSVRSHIRMFVLLFALAIMIGL